MNIVLKVVLSSVIGYLLGSINSSLIIGRFYDIDIRTHGSGNAGVTNTLRTLGKTAALLVLIGDILKGILSCLIGHYIAGETGTIIAGASAIIGHNWPLFFGFKGGKGVLTSFAVVAYIDWKLALLALGAFIIIVSITRYVSLGSMVGAAILPILTILFIRSIEFIIFTIVLGLLVIVKHRSNIERLINGTEAKLGEKTKKM
jgi:glycerol-3-phosphate acyltransferase PlsY